MRNKLCAIFAGLALCFAFTVPAFASGEVNSSTVRVTLTELKPGYYLGAVWDGEELLTFFDSVVDSSGVLETTVDVGKKLEDGHAVTVGVSGKNAGTDSVAVTAFPEKKDSPGGETDRPGSSTGGGGGGSSKPSIRPAVQQDTGGGKPVTVPDNTDTGFADVASSAWYAGFVQYVVEKGLFGGVGNGRFDPDGNMTRAMMWTVLARYRGVETGSGSNWYDAARSWAVAQGISDGSMADGNVTREQFVTMLWRLAGQPDAVSSAGFTDSGNISGYAKIAVDWTVAQGILNGYHDGSFRPQGSASRAEVAKMLTVFCKGTG